MRSLYQAVDGLEARLLIAELAAARIEAVVLGEYLAGAAGELSAFNYPTVWVVDEEQFGAAEKVLETFLAGRSDPPAAARDWLCGRCGAEVDAGFDICWQCGSPRQEPRP
jgi:hypothetical protein